MCKLKPILLGALLAGMSMPVMAGWFSSCEGGSNTARPDWLKPDYQLAGFYTSSGAADKMDKTAEQQRQQAEADAKQHLVEQIEVKIRSENKQSKDVSNDKVQQNASSEISVTADEELRDVKVREHWIDPETCTYYTLVVVSRESVAQTQKEKRSRLRFELMKTHLANGSDKELKRDPQIRMAELEQAQLAFDGIDFASIHESSTQPVYARRIADALDAVNREISEGQRRIACKAFNPDGKLPPAVMRKLIAQMGTASRKVEPLPDDCNTADECRSKARERGYGQLITLKIDTRTEVSSMGAIRGSMTVAETFYDISQNKILKAPPAVSAQVIGWDADSLDWELAADKIAQQLK